jgi:hypothetical protein
MWDLGTIIWLALGVLIAYTLLVALAQLLWAGLLGFLDLLKRPISRREPARPAPNEAHLPAEVHDAPWPDAFTQRFSEVERPEQEQVWQPPAPPPGATCRVCGGPLVYVAYGYPDMDLVELAEQGLVILGGCLPTGPRFMCSRDHSERDPGDPWRSPRNIGPSGDGRSASGARGKMRM